MAANTDVNAALDGGFANARSLAARAAESSGARNPAVAREV
jgi:hypothetical protein